MTLRDIFIRNPNEDAKVVKEYGWERVHLVLTENWTKLIGLNFLYLLCCIPIITIPAATCAMHRVVLNWVRESSFDSVVPAFFGEFKVNFLKRTVFGLLLMLTPFSLTYYPMLFDMDGATVAVMCLTLFAYFCVTKYFYPLVVRMDVSLWENLKNAGSMAILEWRTTGRLLLSAGILDLLLLVLTHYAVPLYIILLCAFNCLLGCAFVNYPFMKYFEPEKLN